MSQSKFFRTVLCLEAIGTTALDSDPVPFGLAILDGEHSGRVLKHEITEVSEGGARRILEAQGSDPDFLTLGEESDTEARDDGEFDAEAPSPGATCWEAALANGGSLQHFCGPDGCVATVRVVSPRGLVSGEWNVEGWTADQRDCLRNMIELMGGARREPS